MNSETPKQIEIYQSEDGRTEIQVRLSQDTIWLTQAQMADLFGKDVRTINEHIKNIFKEEELLPDPTIRKFRIVRQEGKRQVERELDHFNLDMAISVGYRVNSKQGTRFRIWATERLKDYLVKGYSFNYRRFEKNAAELEQALNLIQKTAKSPELSGDAGRGLVDIVSRYTQTFLWLQRYDEGLLEEPVGESGGKLPTVAQAMNALQHLKQNLIHRGEATDLFAKVRDSGLDGIFGNLDQSVFGAAAYPTIESKAAHLLYFVVKNHPFVDGNKRSGAFLFVDFLNRNGRLMDHQALPIINDTGLAALTLLVAESDPKQKSVLIRLIMHMISQPQ
tara:strand:+ start:3727 stop:4728 length:1002 start_codon:yes stop_codon:yes gene_type:complete